MSFSESIFFPIKMTTERLLLADPPADGISTTWYQRVQRHIGVQCYHYLMQHLM
jgi:hypothetical protein